MRALTKFYDYNMLEVILFSGETVPKLKEPELDENQEQKKRREIQSS
jgi:hypothetical protein